MNRPIDQDSVFTQSEGDAWFRRNVRALSEPEIRGKDIPLELVLSLEPVAASVLEVGCATGWRLDTVHAETGAWCVGVDVSEEALREGVRRFKGVGLLRARASAIPIAPGIEFDAVIASFLFHWIDRSHLLRCVAEIDRCVVAGGQLVIADFFPQAPTKVPYHHLQGSGIYTYKQDYSTLFTASGSYQIERMIVYDHGDPAVRAEVVPGGGEPELEVEQSARAAAWLLRKDVDGVYAEVGIGGSESG